MKKLLIILVFVPFLVSAQFPADSIVGCYAGVYKYREEPDTVWTTIVQDTMYVFNVDTVYYNSNEYIGTGWWIKNSGWPLDGSMHYFKFDSGYVGICTINFDFSPCSYSIDSFIKKIYANVLGGERLMFSNNDSAFFVQKLQPGQLANNHYVFFGGKKYSSYVPDSIVNVYIPKIKQNRIIANIYPNPVKDILNIELSTQ